MSFHRPKTWDDSMEKKTHLLVLREIKGLAETSGFLAHFPLLPLSGGKQLFLRQKGDQRHGQGRQTEVDCCADIESHYFYHLTLFAPVVGGIYGPPATYLHISVQIHV